MYTDYIIYIDIGIILNKEMGHEEYADLQELPAVRP